MFHEFHQKLHKLTFIEFEGHDRFDGISAGLTEEELYAELSRAPANDKFLGRYGLEEIRELFERFEIFDRLAELGFPEVEIELDVKSVFNHRLYVYHEQKDYDHMLIELRLREGTFRPKEQFLDGFTVGPSSMVLVDWLMLQNPRREFDDHRPMLPEQRRPGLGLLKGLIPMVIHAVRESGRKGVLDVPEHYHGALFYSPWFSFFSPEMEGRFQAMRRDLGGHPLHQVSHGFDLGCVKSKKTGEVVKWIPSEQLLPIGPVLTKYFEHRDYQRIRDRAFKSHEYELDVPKCERTLAEMEADDARAGGGAKE